MRKRTAVIAAVAVLAVGGGVAYAAWSSTGAGSGQVGSTTNVNSTISPVDGAGGLYPGHTVSFQVTIDNPNGYPVTVTSISAGASALTQSGCAAGTVTSAAVSNPSGTIVAGGTGTYTLQATMNADAADTCKSQTFTLPLTAALVSAA
ncbi:LEA type 2 family protein [Lentzea alba]|uniref:NDR1/HIN1-like protein n=1 Tax=Lentzea alba TaxID=2714351 RepID=UPI0039BEDF29